MVGYSRGGAFEPPRRGICSAQLQRDHAAKMQYVRIVGMLGEKPFTKGLGGSAFTRDKQLLGLLEQLQFPRTVRGPRPKLLH